MMPPPERDGPPTASPGQRAGLESRAQVYLRPGDLFLGSDPTLVTTVLGSCVAVTMFNARLQMGGICHALLADPLRECSVEGSLHGPYKYVSQAITAMTQEFFRLGITPAEMEVKLFGGANALTAGGGPGAAGSVGQSNILRARELLEQANLRPCRTHVGGMCGRKILFDTATGVVLLKQLHRPNTSTAHTHGHP